MLTRSTPVLPRASGMPAGNRMTQTLNTRNTQVIHNRLSQRITEHLPTFGNFADGGELNVIQSEGARSNGNASGSPD